MCPPYGFGAMLMVWGNASPFQQVMLATVDRDFPCCLLSSCLNAIEIRLQLETLLAEKARLAHENSVYARENRFLREIVEYHQLTMQDVIYVDEGIEEVTEVYPTQVLPPTPSRAGRESASPAAPTTPRKPPTTSQPSPLATASSFVLPETCPIVPTSPQPSPSAVTPNTRATSPPV